MQKNNWFIVSDFDGTIIKKNSFPMWIKFVLARSAKEGRLFLFFSVLWLTFLRKVFKVLSHASFKSKIDDIQYPKEYSSDFMLKLEQFIVPQVINKLKEYDTTIIVSTAAPRCYACAISELLQQYSINASNVLSSHQIKNGYFDNYKKNKTLIFDSNDWEIEVFFTDSLDDVSMISLSRAFYYCGEEVDFGDNQNKLLGYFVT